MDCSLVESQIIYWLTKKIEESKQKGFVVGVSGGIDSALVSTLCAKTGLPTIVVSLPIGQRPTLADRHIVWLTEKHPNVKSSENYLDTALYSLESLIWADLFECNPYSIDTDENRDLVSANLRSRLRMCTLYAFANASGFLVVGTGNKVEDYGVGFFTKYGDGGVDLSPIGNLLKSEVRTLSSHMGIIEEIVKAAPTDGLWADARTDEDQIGASYDELEEAMEFLAGVEISETTLDQIRLENQEEITERQWDVLAIYLKRHNANQHKMTMPPICIVER